MGAHEVAAAMTAGFGFTLYVVQGGVSIGSPFIHGDGDGFCAVVEHTRQGWRLSDRGDGVGHLFYGLRMEQHLSDEQLSFVRRIAKHHGMNVRADWVITTDWSAEPPDEFALADWYKVQSILEATLLVAPAALPVVRDER